MTIKKKREIANETKMFQFDHNVTKRFEGHNFFADGITWVVPSLSVKQARQLWPKIRELNQGITVQNVADKYDIALDVIFAAFERNYPGITRDYVGDLVDLKNMRELILAIAGQSGILSKGLEPGEIESKTLIGTTSTESSSPAPAGPLNT